MNDEVGTSMPTDERSHLEQRWIVVTDAQGRERLEARWIIVGDGSAERVDEAA